MGEGMLMRGGDGGLQSGRAFLEFLKFAAPFPRRDQKIFVLDTSNGKIIAKGSTDLNKVPSSNTQTRITGRE